MSLQVFLIARLLAHQHDRVGWRSRALAEHCLCSELPQMTRAAACGRVTKLGHRRTRRYQRSTGTPSSADGFGSTGAFASPGAFALAVPAPAPRPVFGVAAAAG